MRVNEILKAKKLTLDQTVERLKAALSKAADKQSKEFFIKQLDILDAKGLGRDVTKSDIDVILKDVKENFGSGIKTLSERPFLEGYVNVYGQGKRKVNADFSLNDPDIDAINVMKDYSTWWVKDKTDKRIVDSLKSELNDALEEGLTRKQLAANMKKSLKSFVDKSDVYWEVLADHMLTKVQSMGNVSGYEEAEIENTKVIAVIDAKTTPVCRKMHGRIIAVKVLSKQRDKIIKAAKKQDTELVKKAQPMINGATKLPKKTSDIVKKHGLGLPPYHFRCRTTTVAFFEKVTEYQILTDEEKGIIDAAELDEKLNGEVK